MACALELADLAASRGEVPVGAIVVGDGKAIGRGWNSPIESCDPSAHAEIAALRDAARHIGNYRLPGTCVYTTLEPCPMCAGALIHARVARVVYAAPDPNWGAAGSVYDILVSDRLNHRPECVGGVMSDQVARRLRAFFAARR